MAEDRIDSIIDLTKTGEEVKTLKDQIKSVIDLIASVKSKSVEITTVKSVSEYNKLNKELGALVQQTDQAVKASTTLAEAGKKTADGMKFQIQSFKEFGATLTDSIQKQIALKNRLDEIRESLKKLNEFEEAGRNSKEFADEVVRLTAEQAHLQNALAETNREIKLQVKEIGSEEETLKQARASNALLIKQRDETNVKTEEGRKKIAELNLEIDKNNDLIKENSSTLEKVKINIGNYAGSLAGAFDKVTQEIQKLQTKQQQLVQQQSANPIGFKLGGGENELNQVNAALQQLNQTTQIGFKVNQNATQQVRQLENAYVALATSGNQSTEFLELFKNEIGKVKDEVGDLKESIKLAASDTRQLDVLIGTAQAIAGGFAIAQGAAAAFGDENEDLQKTLVKLNGIMTILNGLQAIQAELKKKDNILTVVQTNLQKVYTVVVGTSTGAMKAFRLALAATGIGAAILLIGYLITKYKDLSSATSQAAKNQKTIGDVNKKAAENYAEEVTSLKLLSAEYTNSATSLKRKKEIQDELQESYPNYFKDLDKHADKEAYIATQVDKVTQALIIQSKVQAAQGLLAEKFGDLLKKQIDPTEAVSTFDAVIAGIKNTFSGGLAGAGADLAEKSRENLSKAEKEYADFEKFIIEFVNKSNAELFKLGGDPKKEPKKKKDDDSAKKAAELAERIRKAEFEATKALQEERVKIQEEIFKDESKSFDVRIEALRQFVQEKARLIELERTFEKGTPGITKDEVVAIEAKKQSELNDLVRNGHQEYNKILEQQQKEEVAQHKETADRVKKIHEDLQSDIEKGLKEANDRLAETVREREELEKSKEDLRVELVNESEALIFDILTAGFDRRKNLIQDEIDLLERKKQKDIEVANATITNAQDRAAAITVIEARAAAEHDILEQKKRQIDLQRARFEKAQSVASIITNTAVAVVKSLDKPALIPLIVAIGAAQLARVIATPIPKFSHGGTHKGGLMIVGDGGKSEGIELPDGTIMKTPSVPTLMDAPRDTKIHPDFSKMMLKATVTNVPVFKETTRSDQTAIEVKSMKQAVVTAIKKIPQQRVTVQNIISQRIRSGNSNTTIANAS